MNKHVMDLTMKWRELMDNPFFRNASYKVKLNKFGQILLSPASNRHGVLQNKVAKEIENQKRSGIIINEYSILTSEGVRVAGAACTSDEFFAEFGETSSFPKTPEIYIDVKPPAYSKSEMEEKIRLYLEKGALEVCVVDEYAKVAFYTHTGK